MVTAMALVCSALLVILNAFFVASEFAIVKIRPTRLETLAGSGSRRARLALGMTRRLDVYLSANQLGITLASLALGWIGEPAFTSLIRPVVDRFGTRLGAGTSHAVSVAIGFVLITLLHTVFGELVPKSLAIQRTEPVALWTAGPLRGFYILLMPIIWSLNKAAVLVLKVLRLRPATESESLNSPEELRLVVRHVQMEGPARALIDRVFDYRNRIARHVMTLRRDVVVLQAGRPFDDNLAIAIKNQFTRYPLVDAETERVLGYVHTKDLLTSLASGRQPALMRELAREPLYTFEGARLEDLRKEFQARRVHIAIVHDEAGRFSGIVTLEDLIEELLGEIRDEQDTAEVPPIVRSRVDGGAFEADGRVTLDVATRELGLVPGAPIRGVETLDELIRSRLAAPPKPGDRIEAGGIRFTILEARDGKVRRIRGQKRNDPQSSDPPK